MQVVEIMRGVLAFRWPESTLSDERQPAGNEATSSADRRTILSWTASSGERTRSGDASWASW